MNQQLQDFARTEIKNGLAKCTEVQRLFFKRMYSHDNLERDISAVVDGLPEEKLDWAMQQVERTLSEASDEA